MRARLNARRLVRFVKFRQACVKIPRTIRARLKGLRNLHTMKFRRLSQLCKVHYSENTKRLSTEKKIRKPLADMSITFLRGIWKFYRQIDEKFTTTYFSDEQIFKINQPSRSTLLRCFKSYFFFKYMKFYHFLNSHSNQLKIIIHLYYTIINHESECIFETLR